MPVWDGPLTTARGAQQRLADPGLDDFPLDDFDDESGLYWGEMSDKDYWQKVDDANDDMTPEEQMVSGLRLRPLTVATIGAALTAAMVVSAPALAATTAVDSVDGICEERA